MLDLKEELRKYLQSRGSAMPSTSREAMAALTAFYRDVRVEGCQGFDDMGDALLVEWSAPTSQVRPSGTRGAYFHFSITRQLITKAVLPRRQGEFYQLTLRFSFPLEGDLATLAPKMTADQKARRWCRHPMELPTFEAFVVAQPAFRVTADRQSDEEPWCSFSKV